MDKDKDQCDTTLDSIAAQLDRIEKRLDTKDKEFKDAKDWKDIKELGGLFLLGAGIVYLFMTGGIGAIIEWIKSILLPG